MKHVERAVAQTSKAMEMARWSAKRIAAVVGVVMVVVLVVVTLSLNKNMWTEEPAPQPRRSICQPPPLAQGAQLIVQQVDSGLKNVNDRVQRVLSYSFDPALLVGGDIYLCTEYGRIEILDSDNDQARLEIRVEASAADGTKAVNETTIAARFNSNGDRFSIGAWLTTQGFTPAQQPAWVYIRLAVPASGSYAVDATANHGGVGIHLLTIERGKLSGREGLKQTGRSGYVRGHELDHITLRGDLEVQMSNGPISGSLYAQSSGRVKAHTEHGDIQLFFESEPRVGFDVVGGTNQGTVKVEIGLTEAADDKPKQYVSEVRARSQGYAEKPIRMEVAATTLAGNVVIASPK